jgi:catechol 2,3-dioxygenase-like lactoylglutathione lyase family enzyme
MFKRIDHVELITDQPERTERFYTEVLGFKVRSRNRVGAPGASTGMNIVYLDLGGTTIELINHDGATPAPAPTGLHLGYNLIALEVEDMSKALDYLRTKAVEAVWGPVTLKNAARAEITDPNGYHIELRQWF